MGEAICPPSELTPFSRFGLNGQKSSENLKNLGTRSTWSPVGFFLRLNDFHFFFFFCELTLSSTFLWAHIFSFVVWVHSSWLTHFGDTWHETSSETELSHFYPTFLNASVEDLSFSVRHANLFLLPSSCQNFYLLHLAWWLWDHHHSSS